MSITLHLLTEFGLPCRELVVNKNVSYFCKKKMFTLVVLKEDDHCMFFPIDELLKHST